VTAELLGSEVLGSTWADAELGERNPEEALGRQFIAHVRSRPSPAGGALLAACALVADDPLRAELDLAVAELDQIPTWAEGPVPAPTQAWLAQDPWGEQQMWFLRYVEPAEHVLVAGVTHPGGTEVITLMITTPEALQDYDDVQADLDDVQADLPDALEVPAPRHEVPVAQALSELRDAFIHTDLLWPRERSKLYCANRLLWRRRVLAHAGPRPSVEALLREADTLPGAAREALSTRFLAQQPTRIDKDDAGHLVGLFLDYGEGNLHGGPLAWTPTDISLFLLDWVPRKTVLDSADRQVLPALLAAWVRFALAERGLEDRWISVVVDAVEEDTQDFLDGFDDPSLYGPAQQLASWLSEEGVDLDDQAGMETAVRQWNAMRLARRLVTGAAMLPPGSAARVTIVLRDVRPRVWRRIVVPAEVTLDQLHTLVQVAMGWQDAHLHQWEADGQRYGAPDADSGTADERQVRLLSLAEPGQSVDYMYDFGDGWAHRVTVDEILLPEVAGDAPRCEAGRRACPPEDIGGAPGYAELLAALTNRTAGSDWERELVDMHAGYDPDHFDPQAVTSRMRAFWGG